MDATTTGPGLTILDYAMVVRRRPWTIAIPFALALFIGTAIAFLMDKQYEAVASFEVSVDSEMQQLLDQSSKGSMSAKDLVSTVSQTIRRYEFLSPLLLKYRIDEGYDISTLAGLRDLFSKHVMEKLEVKHTSQQRGPDVIAITYRGQGAKKVAAFVTDVRDTYIESILEQQRDRLREMRDVFRANREQYDKTLQRLKGQKETLSKKHSDLFSSVGNRRETRVFQKFNETEERLKQSQLDLNTARADFDRQVELMKLIPKDLAGTLDKEPNPAYLEISRQLDAKRAQKNRLLTVKPRHQPNHPDVLALEKEERQLEDLLESLVPTLETQQTGTTNPDWIEAEKRRLSLESRVAALEAQIATDRQTATQLGETLKRMPEIDGEIKALEDQILEMTFARQKKAEVEEQVSNILDILNRKSGTAFKILETPLPEHAAISDPVWPNVPLIMALAAMIGLAVGVAVAFASELLSGAFLTEGQVGRILPVQVLGGIAMIPAPVSPARRRRLTILLGVATLIFLAVVLIHLCYFVDGLRRFLPPRLFEALNDIYGAV